MKILKCPKCGRSGGGLHFKPGRPGTQSYPYVKHYKQRPCSISFSDLSQIEFLDLKLNAWKSVLDPKDWHKIPGLASRYSSIDLYLNRSDFENIYEKFLNIISIETAWVKKAMKKQPTSFTHYDHIVQMPKVPSTVVELFRLAKEIEKLRENNEDPNLLLFHIIVVRAHNFACMARDALIQLVPLEAATTIHVKGKKKTRIMTGKTKLRILKMHTREVLPIFEPQNRDEALASHFYGIQCPNEKCRKAHRSWRTDLATDGIDSKGMCHACGTTGFEAGIRPDCPQCHRPFYDNSVREMIKTAVDDGDRILVRCIYCKEEVYFPKKHVETFSDVLLI